MSPQLIVDGILLVILLGAVFTGWRAGLLRSAAGLLGFVAGGIAAYLLFPWVTQFTPSPQWRVPTLIITAIILIGVGSLVGRWLGRILRRGASVVMLGGIDRLLGAAGRVSVAAALSSLLASGIPAVGIPVLSPALASSVILRTIGELTPAAAKTWLAQLRSTTVDTTIPWLLTVIEAPTAPPDVPAEIRSSPALARATDSVGRITRAAYECGGYMAGWGFVIGPGRVVTNAHVVAGVTAPVVEPPGEAGRSGRVVAFDAANDLALIDVPDLRAAPLTLAAPQPPSNTTVAVVGYPFGGPRTIEPGRLLAEGELTINNNGTGSRQNLITLAANLLQGNSGGPILTSTGEVAGVVFAKSDSVPHVAYAIPLTPLKPPLHPANRIPHEHSHSSPGSSHRTPRPELKASAGAVIGSTAMAIDSPGKSREVYTCTYPKIGSAHIETLRPSGAVSELTTSPSWLGNSPHVSSKCRSPTRRPLRKSHSVPSTCTSAMGSSRSSKVMWLAASTLRIRSSVATPPILRYGCEPIATGAESAPSFSIRWVTLSPSATSS